MERLRDPVLVANIQKFLGVKLEPADKDVNQSNLGYRITNKLWYWLFVVGTALGDEVFYSAFIPFWFWNIDGAVGRRVVLVWSIVMYIGQCQHVNFCWTLPHVLGSFQVKA